MSGEDIIARLPYSEPFLFVDEIVSINEKGITGTYTFSEDAFFYRGHFKDRPVTPGVILTECMAQIGLVCLGIYLLGDQLQIGDVGIALTQTNIEFTEAVLPNSKITVVSEIQYFRFHKLKCKVKSYNQQNTLVAQGEIAGMLLQKNG